MPIKILAAGALMFVVAFWASVGSWMWWMMA